MDSNIASAGMSYGPAALPDFGDLNGLVTSKLNGLVLLTSNL